jgi:pimeloyl-ACP methyl ester carboxylesterase
MTAVDKNFRYDTGVPAGSLEIWVDGVRLAVAREGAGPPVVCLHAIGHGGRDFEAFVAAVRDRFEVIRVDWPNQGRSGSDTKPTTPRRYADLLRGVVVQLKLDDPIIVGCSIGGAASINYASRYPAKALVLANSGGLIEVTEGTRRGCRFFARIFAAGARGAWWFKLLFSIFYRQVLPAPAAMAQRGRIVRSAYEIAPVLADAWRHFAVESEADHRQMALAFDGPVLIAWAVNDKINRLADIVPVIQQMRNARLVKFDGGHAAFLEYPEPFVREFREFIAGAGVLDASVLDASVLDASVLDANVPGTGACPDVAIVT